MLTKFFPGALDAFGRVDILVNNAGIIKRCGCGIDVPKQDWDSVINVNLNMVFLLCQAFAKQYVKQGDGGKIINVLLNAFISGWNTSSGIYCK